MKWNEIVDFKYMETARGIVGDINNNITGRVALNDMLKATHVLYIIKNLLGDKCKTVLEIGTLWGGALLAMMQSEYSSKFVSVDMFKGFYPDLLGEGNSDQEYGVNTIELVTVNIDGNNPWKHEYDLIEGSSHDKEVVDYIRKNYPEVEFLFIDGDHSHAAVKLDAENSIKLNAKYIAFDDYNHWQHGTDIKNIINDLPLEIIKEYKTGAGQALVKNLKYKNNE